MMTHDANERDSGSLRVLIVGLVAVVAVIGLALVVGAVGTGLGRVDQGRVDALANSRNDCVTCHRRETPGIVEQYGASTMAAAEVVCQDCHEVAADYPGAVEHEGTYVLPMPTTAMCSECHATEVAQFNRSRHGLPAYVAYAGTEGLSDEHLAFYQRITEADPPPNPERNALYALEGEEITQFACEQCHDVGKPMADGSVGDCTKCHLRHEFSLSQVRKPETCNYCHIGPDHPQYEIYVESPHGIAYATGGDTWNWDAEPGTLTVDDFPAPTCATCHISGFGTQATTHDVGERLTWYLFSPVSERRPSWQDNRLRMQGVCFECHNQDFVEDYYDNGDLAVEHVNEWVRESQAITQPLAENGLLTDEPFDEPIDFTSFNLWHHWGRTAKFGVWMQGPDYTQWHGAYEVLHDLAELREMTDEKLSEAGIEAGR
jgi:hydroxylamine dehydrogenase